MFWSSKSFAITYQTSLGNNKVKRFGKISIIGPEIFHAKKIEIKKIFDPKNFMSKKVPSKQNFWSKSLSPNLW